MPLLFGTSPAYESKYDIQADISDIESAESIGQSLERFPSECQGPLTASPITHLAYSWIARSKFHRSGASENMAWMYLYLHQLVYQNVAIENQNQSRITGKSKQQETLVNKDIISLCDAKFGQGRLTNNDRKNNKVFLCLLILPRNRSCFYSNSGPSSSERLAK
jgi:hypothetical protein